MGYFQKFKWLIFSGVVIFIISGLSITIFANKVKQPIKFSHKKHNDNNVSCIVCHRFYEEMPIASIPTIQVCIICHEDVIYLTPEKEKIRRHYQQGTAIPWQQIYSVPENVFFSHRLHYVVGEVDCIECHGNMAQLSLPLTEQPVLLKMENCIDCHLTVESIENPYECTRCHW